MSAYTLAVCITCGCGFRAEAHALRRTDSLSAVELRARIVWEDHLAQHEGPKCRPWMASKDDEAEASA